MACGCSKHSAHRSDWRPDRHGKRPLYVRTRIASPLAILVTLIGIAQGGLQQGRDALFVSLPNGLCDTGRLARTGG
ncbi:hypothetical protein BA177_13275 [Woeseia oceani]|uniref:Uncharacterized protein n=1 Tax=Woeseia oceani TaxID=1548547 RepID=A0A193LHR7_9GAMM|nr:hypothetical protein BA177_13275 [Woeseia oceani]